MRSFNDIKNDHTLDEFSDNDDNGDDGDDDAVQVFVKLQSPPSNNRSNNKKQTQKV